jgi:hypothetical protein
MPCAFADRRCRGATQVPTQRWASVRKRAARAPPHRRARYSPIALSTTRLRHGARRTPRKRPGPRAEVEAPVSDRKDDQCDISCRFRCASGVVLARLAVRPGSCRAASRPVVDVLDQAVLVVVDVDRAVMCIGLTRQRPWIPARRRNSFGRDLDVVAPVRRLEVGTRSRASGLRSLRARGRDAVRMAEGSSAACSPRWMGRPLARRRHRSNC